MNLSKYTVLSALWYYYHLNKEIGSKIVYHFKILAEN